MKLHRMMVLFISLMGAVLFLASVQQKDLTHMATNRESTATVVMPAAIQVILFGGDRFLAANIEAVRALRSFGTSHADEADFRLRVHQVASQLNPCHEDNYWIGNAELSWSGSQQAGLALLRSSMDCRFWDEWPAFFYGFNQYFFNHEADEAVLALESAARRSKDDNNQVFFRTLAAVIKTNEINDTVVAIRMLEAERDQASNSALRDSLDKRVRRLHGLLILREAQATYQRETGLQLKNSGELLEKGYLDEFPSDPLQVGYEFRDGSFHLRQSKVRN